ncbi:MAG: hypothetical protein IKM75_11250, partial [Bacteroidales bacterium]|nr:hypothetical protein [Bacteroidales bacterium]
PEFYNDGSGAFTLGNTSLYSLFEGNITENLSFSVANHWAGFYSVDESWAEDTKALYRNTLKRTSNWLDWAYLTYSFGDFSISLGKDMMTTGGIEFDDYDFDVHPILSSSLWNGLDCYQWGAKLGWSPAEDQELTFQVTTSPYVDDLFGKPWFNYSLAWNGTIGDAVSTIWSATAVQTDRKEFFWLANLGQRAELGDWTLGLDLSNATMMLGDLAYGLTVMPSVAFALSEKIDFFAKGGFETLLSKDYDGFLEDSACWMAGAGMNWHPVENLRLHALAAYNELWDCASVSVGATYYLNFGK